MDLRLSTKSEYGLRAMIDIASQGLSKPVQVVDISRRQSIPRESLAVLMVDLRRAGLVASVRGPSGGYSLTKSASAISLKEIIEALEGSLTLTQARASRSRAAILVQGTWSRLLGLLLAELEETSLEDLINGVSSMSKQRASTALKSTPDLPDGYAFSI